ncbi:MAG: NAD(P)/FAD-dependent oxidoreductase [Acidobacteria bacterium]|nr:NAD(P)/FAD-dependent oxidoreductase [Acidobacteriota bacterium]
MKVMILGAGPAGLTAAKLLSDRKGSCEVFERDGQVGGLAKTIQYKGYRFDIGGHRFFTKIPWVQEFWRTILGDSFLRVPRLSRIYYNGRFFHYPLRPWNALTGLGLWRSFHVFLSYVRVKLFPFENEEFFEPYVVNRFGRLLYLIFFRTYTEKVWGIPCTQIRAEWAAQRIKGLSLWAAALHAFRPHKNKIKTLIEQFEYPLYGPGMMWEKVQELVESRGCRVHVNTPVVKLYHDYHRILEAVIQTRLGQRTVDANHFLSSIPLQQLIEMLDPPPPDAILKAANMLSYRDFITVNLIINKPSLFPDNWLYIHTDHVRTARIQNYKNWSAAMAPDPNTTSLGMEYFCFEGDRLWNLSSDELIEVAKRDLSFLKLAAPEDVIDGFVFKETKAYPMYNGDYRDYLSMIRGYLAQFENLQPMGRNGLHKYNNQDHSMLCARYAVENLGGAKYDLWEVNSDSEYQEEIRVEEGDRKRALA